AACVALTRKFFTLPGVPEPLAQKRRRAVSNAHLEGMKWAWECGRHWRTVSLYALRAALVDPSNAARAFGRFQVYVAADAGCSRALRWTDRLLTGAQRAGRRLRRLAGKAA